MEQLAVALAGAPLGDTTRLVPEPLAEDDFMALLRLCEDHRLLGTLADAVENGRVAVDDGQLDSLTQRYLVWLSNSLEVERLLLRVAECCAQAGIEMRVLKGAALARLAYPDPSSRVFADLDLLIPATRFDDAVRLAVDELGGTQSIVELRPGFDREFGKDATVLVGRVELDLHRTFVTGPFGLTIPLDDLFTDSTPLVIGGRTFSALGPTALLMHAFYNAALGDYPVRLCSLRDLMLLSERPEADFRQIRVWARQWRAAAVVQRGAALVVETLGLPGSHGLWQLAGLDVPRRERWALASYLTPARSYSRPLASLLVIPGVRARMRLAGALVRPSAAYLHSRGWTERSHIRRAVARFRKADRD